MAGTPTPPPGFKLDTPTPPPGFKLDGPSVTDPPEALGPKLKRIGKSIVPIAAGMAVPVAAGAAAGAVLGPEASEPVAAGVRTAGQAIGGALAPYVEDISKRLFGEYDQPVPTLREALHSAVVNGVFAGAGEGLAAVTKYAHTEKAVTDALAKLPQSEQTVGKIKQIREAIAEQATKKGKEAAEVSEQNLRNRDFWKAHGLDDKQIDQVVASPELQQELGRSIEKAQKLKAAVQTTFDQARSDFHARYQPLLQGPAVESKTLGESMLKAAQGAESPKLKSWLTNEGTKLTTGPDPLQGLIPADELAGMSAKQRQAYLDALPKKGSSFAGKNAAKESRYGLYGPQSIIPGRGAAPVEDQITRTPEQLQGLRTDLAKQLSGNVSNTDIRIKSVLHNQMTTALQQHMTPEQRGAFDALDAEYARFQDVLRKLDPRSEHYGQNVADTLFDPAAQNRGAAMSLIDMAQKADAVKPGVMADLREGFLDKAMSKARVPGQPMEELALLRKLQDQWGGAKESRAVMGAMFGKDSPLADPATFTKVVEAANDPEPIIKKTGSSLGRSILSSPYMQGMVMFGVGAAAAGIKGGGLWSAISGQKGVGPQALAIGSLLAGPPMIKWMIRSGNGPAQRAMVAYLTNPNAETAVRYAGAISGGLGAQLK